MFHELQIFENPEAILLIASIIFFFSIIAGKAGFRFGLPALLLFLGVGMLFGSDGLGIQFSNPSAAQFIGMLALSIILFSGGMDTKVSEIKPIATEGVILATVGVLLTTLITGAFIYYVFLWSTGYETLTIAESMLMAAVMSSTDSASVFSILRSKGVYLKQRLRPTLELESGSNDPDGVYAYLAYYCLYTGRWHEPPGSCPAIDHPVIGRRDCRFPVRQVSCPDDQQDQYGQRVFIPDLIVDNRLFHLLGYDLMQGEWLFSRLHCRLGRWECQDRA